MRSDADDEKPIEFERTAFDRLIQQGKVTGLKTQLETSLNEEAKALLLMASKQDLENAYHRYNLLKLYCPSTVVQNYPL